MNFPMECGFTLSAVIDGKKIDFGSAGGTVDGFEFSLDSGTFDGAGYIRFRFANRGGGAVRLDELRMSFSGGWFDAACGKNTRIIREGWGMVSPCGVAAYGDRDYQGNPDYMNFAYSKASLYNREVRNEFNSEYAVALRDDSRPDDVLFGGFITSADAVSRFEVALSDDKIARFDAVCGFDGILFEAGDEVRGEKLVFLRGADVNALFDRFGALWGRAMNARRRFDVPRGWCSWYYYFEKVTEADIVENLKFLSEHRNDFPLEYFQIDDGYEADLGDYLSTKIEFPSGVRKTVETISGYGFKPGLWLAPFMVTERTELANCHPECLVHNRKGEVIWVMPWRGARVGILDATHPLAQEYLRKVFGTLRGWGVKYVKLDFMCYAASQPDGVYYNPKATRVQALRRGLEVIRESFGNENFILGCTTLHGPSVGIVDAQRISTDITPYWATDDASRYDEAPSIPFVCRNQILHRYMHRHLFINDPDVHIARRDNNKLTENEVILWTTALWLAGGMDILTDKFSTLDADRAELSKLLLRRTDAFRDVRPEDIFDRAVPSVWSAAEQDTGRRVYGLFNFGETADIRSACTGKPGARWREYWSGDSAVSDANGNLSVEIPPHSCRLFFAE